MKLLDSRYWPIRRSISKHLASLIAASLAFAPISSSAQQPTGTNATYTTIKDFSYGTLLNTTTALTPIGTTGQVQFSRPANHFHTCTLRYRHAARWSGSISTAAPSWANISRRPTAMGEIHRAPQLTSWVMSGFPIVPRTGFRLAYCHRST